MELWTSPTPNGWKATIMVEELRDAGHALADLQVRTVNLAAGEQFTPECTARNPNRWSRERKARYASMGSVIAATPGKAPGP